jgi:peroxiredoxin
VSKTSGMVAPGQVMIGLALAGALALAGCSRTGKPAATAQNKPAAAAFNLDQAVGVPIPAFSLKDADGQTVHASDYKGKVVLLDFWATWCGPCKIEIPWFIDFEREFKDQGLAVVGVSMDEDGWKAIKPYVQNMKMNYRVLLGDDAVSTAYGGLDSLPTTLLIDRQGKIAAVHVGVSEGKEEFKNEIVKLLASSSVSAPVVPRGVLAVLAGDRLRPDGR